MAETDITLTVGLDTKDADKTAKQLQKEVEDIFNSRSGQQSASLTSLELQMKQTSQKAQELRETLSRIGSEKIPTDQYQNLSKELEKANTYYDKLAQKSEAMSSFEDMWKNSAKQVQEAQEKVNAIRAELESLKTMPEGLTGVEQLQFDAQLFTQQYEYTSKLREAEEELEKVTKAHQKLDGQKRVWDNLQAETLRAAENVGVLEDEMEKLESSGQAFKIDNEAYNKTQTELDKINDKLKQQIIHHKEIEGKLKGSSKEMNNLANATNKTRKASGKMSSSFSKGLGTMMKTAKRAVIALGALFLGARGLMSIFTKLRSAILEGFKNLEQSNISKLKQQMEDLKNASTTMKNALIGAFEPIVTMIIPYIQRLVEWLTIAIDKMAQFIAAVSGQKTYIKAIKQVGNAAEKAGNQAKKALGPLDNLNVLTTPGGGGAGEMFEEVAIPDSMFDKIEKLKEIFKAMADEFDRLVATPFKEGFFSVLPDAEQRLGRIKDNIMSISDTIMEIANNPEVQQASEGFVQAFWKNQGAWIGLGAKIGLIVGENITGGVDQFLSQHKNEIQTDIVKNLGITEERLDTATKLAEAIGKIIEPLSEQDAIDTTSATIGIMYENISGIGTVVNELTTDLSELAANPIIENADSLNESLSILLKILSPLAQGIEKVAGAFKRTFISIYEEGVGPVIDEVTRVLTEFVGMVSEWWNNGLGPFLQGIAEDLKGIFEEYVSPIIEDLGGVIVELLVPLKDAVEELWDEALKPLFNWFIETLWPAIQPILQGIWNILKGLIKEFLVDIDKVLFTIKYFLKILNDLYHGDFTKVITDVQEFITGFLERNKKKMEGMADVIKGVLGIIQGIITGAITLIKGKVTGFVDHMKQKWDDVKGLMDTFAQTIGGGFETAWNNVKDTIDRIIIEIENSVGAFVDWVNEAISNITSGFETAKNAVSNFFSGGSTVNSGGGGRGGHTRSGAASGAVIPPSMSEHLIKVGDNNVETEIISPLSTMKEAMIEALSQTGIGGNGTQQIVLQLDGKTFMTAMVNQNNEYKKMHGGQSAYA